MVDADDFDVEGLRALLRGEKPQPQPAAAPATKPGAGKAAAARPGKTKPAARPKKRR